MRQVYSVIGKPNTLLAYISRDCNDGKQSGGPCLIPFITSVALNEQRPQPCPFFFRDYRGCSGPANWTDLDLDFIFRSNVKKPVGRSRVSSSGGNHTWP